MNKRNIPTRLCARAEAPHHIDGWWGRKNKQNEHQHDCACEPRLTVISTAGGDEGINKKKAPTRLCVRAEAHRHIDGWWRRKKKQEKHQRGFAREPKLTVISTAGGDERINKQSTNTTVRASRSSPSYRRLV